MEIEKDNYGDICLNMSIHDYDRFQQLAGIKNGKNDLSCSKLKPTIEELEAILNNSTIDTPICGQRPQGDFVYDSLKEQKEKIIKKQSKNIFNYNEIVEILSEYKNDGGSRHNETVVETLKRIIQPYLKTRTIPIKSDYTFPNKPVVPNYKINENYCGSSISLTEKPINVDCKIVVSCECGGDKCRTTHSEWCPKHV